MKSFFVLFFALSLAAALQAAPNKDQELTPQHKAYIAGALPDKAYVTPEKPRKILVFSRTTTYRHVAGIPALKEAFMRMGEKTGAWETIVSDDLANFEPEKLREFDCVVMNNTTGAPFAEQLSDIAKMTPEQRAPLVARDKRLRGNLVEYVKNGGGLVAIHAGADAYANSLGDLAGPDYVEMVGAVFHSHPWGGNNDPETFIVEDMCSPLTEGIWPQGEFVLQDEIYMFGSEYDRKNLRVLTGMDVGRSPITVERMKKSYIRPDGDIPVSWVKDFGKGRVFYGSLGHRRESYYIPEVLEHYLRGIQYACGDLKGVDTSFLPFVERTKKTPAAMTVSRMFRTPVLLPAPSFAQIEALRDVPYGERTDDFNRIFFATADNNRDASFCKNMAAFALRELAAKGGTDRYRVLLADILENVGLGENVTQAKALCAAEPNAPFATVLQNVVAHHEATGIPFGFKMGDTAVIPETAPADERALFNVIGVLQDNPSLQIPAYLKLEALKEGLCRTRLIYALAARGQDLDKVLALEPADASEAMAIAYAATKGGDDAIVAKVAGFAKLLKRPEQSALAVCIQEISCKNRAQAIVSALRQAEGPAIGVLVEALSGVDAGAALSQIYDGLRSPETDVRKGSVRILATVPDKATFLKLAEAFPAEQDAAARAQMQGVMSKIAAVEFDAEMFEAVARLYGQLPEKDRAYFLRFAPMISNARALALCREAAIVPALRSAALSQLAKWKNAKALPVLIAIAQASATDEARAEAQEAVVDYCEKGDMSAEALIYILATASPELKQRMADAAVNAADPDFAKPLRDAGFAAQADLIAQSAAPIRLSATASHNAKDVALMTDTKAGTRWVSRDPIVAGMWIEFDMGGVRRVRDIELLIAGTPDDAPEKVTVLAGRSADAMAPVEVAYATDGHTAKIIFTPPVTARFVRIVAAGGSLKPGKWWSVFEARINGGVQGAQAAQGPAMDKSKIGVKVSHNARDVAQMTDINLQSRWTSREPITDGMWVLLDLGAVRPFSEVDFLIKGASEDTPEKIRVLAGASEDALKPVNFAYASDGESAKIAFAPPVTARFVKVVAASAHPKGRWWSVFDLQVK